MPATRPIRLPSPEFFGKPLPLSLFPGLDTLRVHGLSYPAAQFRLVPSHCFSHPDASCGLLYLGEDLETCLWECFGDAMLEPGAVIARSRWMHQCLSRIRSPREFRLCDLTQIDTRAALKVDLSALQHPSLEIPQAWGLAILGHPEKADGMCYLSRFTGRRCIVLFDRSGKTDSQLKSTPLGTLAESEEAGMFLEKNEIALV